MKGEDEMAPEPQSQERKRKIRNEAMALYEMNADDMFRTTGHVVIDSSLGLVTESAPSHSSADPAKH